MKKALLAVMAIALVIGFAGCSLFGGAKSPYCPLAEGNKWDYEMTVMSSTEYVDTTYTKNMYDTTTTTYSSEVVGETELTGDEAIKVWEIKSGDETSYVDVDKDWVYIYDDISDSEEWYKWPNEPKKDDSWKMIVEAVDTLADPPETTTVTTTYTVEEEGATAFGDYTDCLKIKVLSDAINLDDYTEYENWMYMAKDKGTVYYYVKIVMGDTTYTMTIESETKLTDFTEGS